eukprot:1530502-Amphidinium_carterae.1
MVNFDFLGTKAESVKSEEWHVFGGPVLWGEVIMIWVPSVASAIRIKVSFASPMAIAALLA